MKEGLLKFLALVTGYCCCAASGSNIYSYFIGSNKTTGLNAPIFDASGKRLSGDRFLVRIYGGSTTDSLAPVCYSSFQIVPPVGFQEGELAGYFRIEGGSIFSPRFNGFGATWLQVKAWDSSLGSTYEDVASLGLGGYGESTVFLSRGTLDSIVGASRAMIGLESFSLRSVVPEPSTWALLGTGLTLLGWQAWRRRQAPATSAGPALTARGSRDTSP